MQWATLSKQRPTYIRMNLLLMSMPLCNGQRSPDRDQVSPATSALFTLFLLVFLAVDITSIGERPLMIWISGDDVYKVVRLPYR